MLRAMLTVATDGVPEHNCQALPVGDTAQAVVAQRSKNCRVMSEQFFGHRKSANRGKASVRKNNFFCYCLTLRMFLFIEFGYDL